MFGNNRMLLLFVVVVAEAVAAVVASPLLLLLLLFVLAVRCRLVVVVVSFLFLLALVVDCCCSAGSSACIPGIRVTRSSNHVGYSFVSNRWIQALVVQPVDTKQRRVTEVEDCGGVAIEEEEAVVVVYVVGVTNCTRTEIMSSCSSSFCCAAEEVDGSSLAGGGGAVALRLRGMMMMEYSAMEGFDGSDQLAKRSVTGEIHTLTYCDIVIRSSANGGTLKHAAAPTNRAHTYISDALSCWLFT